MRLRQILKKYFRPLLVRIGLFREREIIRAFGAKNYVRFHVEHTVAYFRDLFARGAYVSVSLEHVRARKKSDRVYIFGSGYSLHDISPEGWAEISKHDTLGFTGFIYQKFIPLDFHLLRGWGEGIRPGVDVRPSARDVAQIVEGNDLLKNTLFILQGEYKALFCNTLIGQKIFPRDRKIFRYHSKPVRFDESDLIPGKSFAEGLNHGVTILCDTINFAYCLGWKEIVLVGVDLYDNRYFWLQRDETYCIDYSTGFRTAAQVSNRGDHYSDPHSTVRNGVMPILRGWKERFAREGVQLTVHNPKSLLKEIMPVFPSSRTNYVPKTPTP